MNAPVTDLHLAVGSRQASPPWTSILLLLVVTIGLGSALSLAAFIWMRHDTERDARSQFERAASDAHHSIEARIKSYTDIV